MPEKSPAPPFMPSPWVSIMAIFGGARTCLAQEAGLSNASGFYVNPIWLSLIVLAAAGFMYEVSWIKSDASGVGIRSPRWVTAFMGGGLVVFLFTFLIHPVFIVLLILGGPAGFIYYLTIRNEHVPRQHRMLGRWLGAEGEATATPEGSGAADVPHVEVDMENPDGRSLAEFIKARPDFADAAELVGDLLAHAAEYEAEEMRIAPGEEGYGVYYGLGGVRERVDTLEEQEARPIIPGMARFLGLSKNAKTGVRFTATLPDRGEIKITARGVKSNRGPAIAFSLPDWNTDVYRSGLEGLGMRAEMIDKLEALIEQPNTILLFSGPSGSGRTSTFHASMERIDIFVTDVMTLETNPEHELDQIQRKQVDVGSEDEMEETLPGVFREGPDVIGVDEIKNPRVISPLLEFARDEGRFFGTIEASSSAKALLRFTRWADSDIVAETLGGITCQRLIRTLCEHCKEEIEPNPTLLKKLKIKPSEAGRWFQPAGCPTCAGTGFRGQTAVYELLTVNDTMKKLIKSEKLKKVSSVKKAAGRDHLMTLHRDALAKVCEGRTTLDEIRRVLK
ncbi:MAG: GspE/PulE family protein [Candidatus Brocadiia bacterium]